MIGWNNLSEAGPTDFFDVTLHYSNIYFIYGSSSWAKLRDDIAHPKL